MADLWHYTSEGKRMEPVIAGELRQLAGAGFLHPEDLVWKQGMTDWVAASSIPGLFPKAAAAAFLPAPATEAEDPPATFEVTPTARKRRSAIDDDDDAPRPRRRRRTADDSPRRRRPEKASGPSLAFLLCLLGGGLFVLLVVVIAIVVAVSRGGGGSIANYTTAIPGNGTDTRDFAFKANTAYEFVLTSNPVSDVDIYLTDLNGHILRSGNFAAADNTIGPNGRIVWVFAVAGMHRVKIHNLGPPMNTSTVRIRELGPGHGIEVPPMMAVNPPINMPFPNVPPIQPMQPWPMLPPPGPVGPAQALPDGRQLHKLPTLGSGQECELTVAYPVARAVTVEVRTIERDPDVDLFVFEVGGPRVFSDVSIGPDCNLVFQAQAGRSYRFVIRNVTLRAINSNSTLAYTSP